MGPQRTDGVPGRRPSGAWRDPGPGGIVVGGHGDEFDTSACHKRGVPGVFLGKGRETIIRTESSLSSQSPADVEALFHGVYPALFRYCHRLTGDGDQADDLAQEAFFRLLDRDVRGPPESLKSWLFRVATNLARDRFRTSRTRERRKEVLAGTLESAKDPGPQEELERREKVARVREVLEALKPRDREMLLLRQEGFSYREIAETVGVAPGSVGSLLARALRRFERELSEREDHDGPS